MNKKAIKIICIFLTAVIVFSSSLPCFADSVENDKTIHSSDYPTIIITGYFMPGLYENYGTKDQKEIWAMKKTLPKLAGVVATALAFLPALFIPGVGEICGKAAARVFSGLFEFSKGSYDYETRSQEPGEASLAYYNENRLNFIDEKLSKELGKKQGADNVFTFAYDWRDNVTDTVEDLNTFIDGVIEYTGSAKVNLFGLSFGGLITGTYLSKYGENGKINNAVLDVPALGGTEAIGKFFENPELKFNTALNYLGDLLGLGINIKKFLLPPETGKAIKTFAENTADITLSWGSFWDLMKTDDYEKMKAAYPDTSAEIFKKSDEIHYEIMPFFRESFARCRENGISISVISDYTDYPSIFGGNERADILIETYLETGANVAPVNKTLGDNYRQACECCGKNHISGDGIIDASCSYLPDNTWFIKDHYHGTYEKDDTTFSLIVELLLTDNEMNVFSDPRYPQFIF